MKLVLCPHCKAHRIATSKVPKEVVVVMPCPNCHELVIVFRQKAIALDRRVIENGTMEERKAHLADVIAEFIEPGMFEFRGLDPETASALEEDNDVSSDATDDEEAEEDEQPISQLEVDRFVKIDLKRLDDPVYFRRHFGR
jgi:hypothetical protein